MKLRTRQPCGQLRVLQVRETWKRYGNFMRTGDILDLRSDENGESFAHLNVDENIVGVAVGSGDGRSIEGGGGRSATVQSGVDMVENVEKGYSLTHYWRMSCDGSMALG